MSAGILLAAFGHLLWSQALGSDISPEHKSTKGPSLMQSITGNWVTRTTNALLTQVPQNRGGLYLQTNGLPFLQNKTNTVRSLLKPLPAQTVLSPGVYETWPYTCIVVVPGAHPDDKSMPGLGRGTAPTGMENMPVIKPDLQFIPRKPKP